MMAKCIFSFNTMGDWEGCALTGDSYNNCIIECNGSDEKKKGCPIWNNTSNPTKENKAKK